MTDLQKSANFTHIGDPVSVAALTAVDLSMCNRPRTRTTERQDDGPDRRPEPEAESGA